MAMDAPDPSRRNRRLLTRLAVIAALMFGFAWALVPMYRVICEATGINRVGQADEVAEAAPLLQRQVALRLDANVQPGLPWQVKPLQNSLSVHPGQFVQLQYEITNQSDRLVVGQAIPRYLPGEAAAHVKKLECFCFRQQAFRPGETRRFPVVLVIDRELPVSINEITLSYTVFEVPAGGSAS